MQPFSLLSATLSHLSAQASFGAVDIVADGQFTNFGGGSFGSIVEILAASILPLMNAIAVLVIVIAGLLAVVAQDESRIANARKVVAMVLVGIILINIANAIGLAFMQAFNFDSGNANPAGGALSLQLQLFGIIDFLETPAAVIAIITIISYGIKALVDYNGEQGLASFKKAVISVLTGIFLITIKVSVTKAVVTSGNPSGIISPLVQVLLKIVGFVSLIGVVVIVLAGIVMVVNVGDEGRYEKAKKVMISVGAGIVLMTVVSGLIGVILGGMGFV